MALDRKVCDDSNALGTAGQPDETPHPALAGEDRCEFHLQDYDRWAEAERKADWRRRAAPADADPLPRGPRGYVPRPRPERYQGIELTRLQARKINEALAGVAIARAPLDSAVYDRRPDVPTASLRTLLEALNRLAAALGPLSQ